MTVGKLMELLVTLPPDALVALEEPLHGACWVVKSIEVGEAPIGLILAATEGFEGRPDVVLLRSQPLPHGL